MDGQTKFIFIILFDFELNVYNYYFTVRFIFSYKTLGHKIPWLLFSLTPSVHPKHLVLFMLL